MTDNEYKELRRKIIEYSDQKQRSKEDKQRYEDHLKALAEVTGLSLKEVRKVAEEIKNEAEVKRKGRFSLLIFISVPLLIVLFNLNIFGFLSFESEPEGPTTLTPYSEVLLLDKFINDTNDWDEQQGLYIHDGYYMIDNRREPISFNRSGLQIPGLDTFENVQIDLRIDLKSFIYTEPFGLFWQNASGTKLYELMINGNGALFFGTREKFQRAHLIEPLKPKAVVLRRSTNLLTLKKVGAKAEIYVNKQFVTQVPLTEPLGTFAGITFSDKTHLAVSRFEIRVPKEEAQKIPPPENISFVPFKRTIFKENFNSNDQKWKNINRKSRRQYPYDYTYIEDGMLCLEYPGIKYFRKLDAPYRLKENSGNFQISATFKKISGKNSGLFGIFWNGAGTNRYEKLLIRTDSRYVFRRHSNRSGSEHPIATTHIKTGNSTNTLTIQRKGKFVEAYINNTFITKKKYRGFEGGKFGIITKGETYIKVESIELHLEN